MDPTTDQTGFGGYGSGGITPKPTFGDSSLNPPPPTGAGDANPATQPIAPVVRPPVKPAPAGPPGSGDTNAQSNYPSWMITPPDTFDGDALYAAQRVAGQKVESWKRLHSTRSAMGETPPSVETYPFSSRVAYLRGAKDLGPEGERRITGNKNASELATGFTFTYEIQEGTLSIDPYGGQSMPFGPAGGDRPVAAFYQASRPLDKGEFFHVAVNEQPDSDSRNWFTTTRAKTLMLSGVINRPCSVWVSVYLTQPESGSIRSLDQQTVAMLGSRKFSFVMDADPSGPGGKPGDHALPKATDIIVTPSDQKTFGLVSSTTNPNPQPQPWTFGVKLQGAVDGCLYLGQFKNWMSSQYGITVTQAVMGNDTTGARDPKELKDVFEVLLYKQDTKTLWITLSVPVDHLTTASGTLKVDNWDKTAGVNDAPGHTVTITVNANGQSDTYAPVPTQWSVDGNADGEMDFGALHQGMPTTKEFRLQNQALGMVTVVNEKCKLGGRDASLFSITKWNNVPGVPDPRLRMDIPASGAFPVELQCQPSVAGELEATLTLVFQFYGDTQERTEVLDIVAGSSTSGASVYGVATGDNLTTGVYNPMGQADSGVAGGNYNLASNTPALALLFRFRHTTDPDVQLAAYLTALTLWLVNKPAATLGRDLNRFGSYFGAANLSQSLAGAWNVLFPTGNGPQPEGAPAPEGPATPQGFTSWTNSLLAFTTGLTGPQIQGAIKQLGAPPLAPGDSKWIELIVTLGFEACNKDAPHSAGSSSGSSINTALPGAIDTLMGGDLASTADWAVWCINACAQMLRSAGLDELGGLVKDNSTFLQGLNAWSLARIQKGITDTVLVNNGVRRALMVPRGFITAAERDEQILAVQNGQSVAMGVPNLGTGASTQQNWTRGAGVWTDIVPSVVKPSQLSNITYWTPPAGGNVSGSNAASGQGVMGGGLGSVPSNYNLMDPQALYQLAGLNPLERLLFLNGRIASVPHRPGDVDSVIAAVKKQQGTVLNRGALARLPPFWVQPQVATLPMTQYKQYTEQQEQALAALVDERVLEARIAAADAQRAAAVLQRQRIDDMEMSKFYDVPRKRRFLDVRAIAPFHNLNPLDIADPESQQLLKRAFVPTQYPDV